MAILEVMQGDLNCPVGSVRAPLTVNAAIGIVEYDASYLGHMEVIQ